MYGGDELNEIEYDLESVTPGQYKAIIKRLQKKGNTCSVPELETNVQQEYFALASGIPAQELNRLSIKDFMTMGQLVRNFFLNDSVEETETTNPETEEEMDDIGEVTDDISE